MSTAVLTSMVRGVDTRLLRVRFAQVVGQAAGYVFHGIPVKTVVLAGVKNLNHVPVIRQIRHDPRLPLKTRHQINVFSSFRGQHLDRHNLSQPRMTGLVHRAHTAGADLFDNLVFAYGFQMFFSRLPKTGPYDSSKKHYHVFKNISRTLPIPLRSSKQ